VNPFNLKVQIWIILNNCRGEMYGTLPACFLAILSCFNVVLKKKRRKEWLILPQSQKSHGRPRMAFSVLML